MDTEIKRSFGKKKIFFDYFDFFIILFREVNLEASTAGKKLKLITALSVIIN